jgi:tetratricopeptide (TPR) repeat protein
VLALDPRRPGIRFRIGRALLARARQSGSEADAAGIRSEAVREFEEELRLDPTNANAAYELGEIHRKAGDLARARALFEKAMSSYPDFADAQLGLGRVLVSSREPERALPHIRKAIALDPQSDVAYYQLSLAYRALGYAAEQQKALAEFQRLRALRPRAPDLSTFVPRQVTKQELDPEAVPNPPQ